MMEPVHMTDLIASLNSRSHVEPSRDRKLESGGAVAMDESEIAQVVKESSRIFLERLKKDDPK